MLTNIIIFVEILTQPFSAFGDGLVTLQINILVLDCAPESFHKNIVVGTALAVHAKLGRAPLPVEYSGKLFRSELATLIRVEHLRPAIFFNGFSGTLLTEISAQCR